MSNKKTPQELRNQFKVIQGGLEDNHVEPDYLSEEELRAEPIGQILQRVYDSYASEHGNFQMPDLGEISPEFFIDAKNFAADPGCDTFIQKRGPFLVDPEA